MNFENCDKRDVKQKCRSHCCLRDWMQITLGQVVEWGKVCSKVEALDKFHIEYFTLAYKDLEGIFESTGCIKPCKYNDYRLVGETKLQELTSSDVIYLRFITMQINIEKELESYSPLSLLSGIWLCPDNLVNTCSYVSFV